MSSGAGDPSIGLTHSGTDRRVECGARYVTWTRWWRCRINRSLPPFDSLKIHIFHSKFQITRVFSKQNHAAAAPWLGHTCFRLNVKPSRKIHLAGVTVPCRGCTFNTWNMKDLHLQFRKHFCTIPHIYQQDEPVTLAVGKSMYVSVYSKSAISKQLCGKQYGSRQIRF